jgi:hypothetical protein
MIWHPHQGLWNWDLIDRVHHRRWGPQIEALIIWVDTLILVLRCVRNRRCWRRQDLADLRVLYIDCGVHEEGWQIVATNQWLRGRVADLKILGFEANPATYRIAASNLETIVDLDLRNVALVGPDHGSATVELFLTSNGKGDSLFAARMEQGSISVPARRLSEELPDLAEFDAVLLRMNIEGAEGAVTDDLHTAGLLPRFSGFFGMWDDLSKIDPSADVEFRRRIRTLGIHTTTFNDRDFENPRHPPPSSMPLVHRLRLRAIRHRLMCALAQAMA